MLKILADRLPELFAAIEQERTLYIPARKGKALDYTHWDPDLEYFDKSKPNKSVKDFFFCKSENIVNFCRKDKNVSIEEAPLPTEQFVIFGVLPCDKSGMDILDMVFLAEPQDAYYQARRDNGLLITAACSKRDETCFCRSFGIDPAEPEGDISVWFADDYLYWEANTEKGKELTGALEKLFEEVNDRETADLESHKEKIRESQADLPLNQLEPKKVSGELLELFDSQIWEELSRTCLGCGACTFICPTCQCYDIQEHSNGENSQRFRCWDSCMYSDFTRMAHGNPRTSQLERFRQRFMHKLVYFPDNNDGQFSCVGCGRCVAKCPVSLNIVKVMRGLEVKNDG